MGRKAKSSEAQLSFDLMEDYESYASDWLEQRQLNEDYFHNKQWTDEEVAILEQRGQFPLTINKITPIILQKVAQLLDHKPSLMALPRNKAANQQAVLWSSMMEYVLQRSHFEITDMAVKQDHAVSGVGWYHAYIDEDADDGKGEVVVGLERPENVRVDPNSRKPDFSDADHILIVKRLTLPQAIHLYPSHAAALKRAAESYGDVGPKKTMTDSYDDEGYFIVTPAQMDAETVNSQDYVTLIERYTRVVETFWVVRNKAGKFMRTVPDRVYRDQFKGDPAWEAASIKRRRIRKYVSAGEDVFIGEWLLPLEDFPLIPVPNYWTGTPFPISDITYLRGMQDEVNKRRSLLILNAALSSSNKWLYEKGSIEEDVWNASAALPNAKLPYKVGYNAPIPVQPIPLPQALAYLEEVAKHDMEAMAGSFPVSHGDSSQAPDTYAATMALEEFGARRLAPSVLMFNYAKARLGQTIIALCQHLYKMPKFIRIAGEKEGRYQEFYLNERRYNPDNGKVEVFNEVDGAIYDVVVVAGSKIPTNRTAEFLKLKDLFALGAIDNQALLEGTDIKDRDEIIQRMSMIAQQRQVIEAQAQEIKQMQGIVMTMRRQSIQLGIKSAVQEYRMLEKSNLLDTAAKARITQELMTLQAKEHALEMEYIEKEAALALKQQQVQQAAARLAAPAKKKGS